MLRVTTMFISFLVLASKGLCERFESSLIVEKIPEYKTEIVKKYSNLNLADIRFYNINYFFNMEDKDAVNVFTESQNKSINSNRIQIGFLISDKKRETTDQTGKEISIPGVLVEASTLGEIINIQKGEFNRRAFIKMDGSYGEYSQGGFSNDMAIRYKNSARIPQNLIVKKNAQPTDPKKTQEGLVTKAKNGDMQAQYMLGMNYLNGTGCIKNEDEGRRWLKAAAAQGSKEAEGELSKIEENQSATNPQQNP